MKQYLIDVNLPYKFSLWHDEDFSHVRSLDDTMSDGAIWDYAKKKNFIIVTKDTDFSERILLNEPPPRVVHIKFGNMRFKEFHEKMNAVWPKVDELIQKYKLVSVYVDRIECID